MNNNNEVVSSMAAADVLKVDVSKAVLPEHYKHGEHDLIWHMKDLLGEEMFRGFMVGNIFKYVVRYPEKNGIEDLEKADEYINRLIKAELEGFK